MGKSDFYLKLIELIMQIWSLICKLNSEKEAAELETQELEKQLAELRTKIKEDDHEVIDFV